MGLALGDYKQVVPLTLLCSKRQAIGGTSSEICRLRGIRYAVCQEPSKTDVMNEGVMKELTGGDPLTGRDLYMPTITFKPMFNLVVCANIFINVNSDDDWTWRRIKPVEFTSRFKDADTNPDADNFEFVKDKKLDEKLELWKEYILYKLAQIAFKSQGIVADNAMIISANKRYRLSQNKPQQFIDEMIIVDNDSKVSKRSVGETFKHWSELKFKYAIKNKELFDILDTIYDSNSTHYQGFRLKEEYSATGQDNIVTKEDKFKTAFEECYIITNDDNDRVLRSSIQEWAKNYGLAIQTSKTINPILEEHFKLKEKKTGGLYHWVGVKKT